MNTDLWYLSYLQSCIIPLDCIEAALSKRGEDFNKSFFSPITSISKFHIRHVTIWKGTITPLSPPTQRVLGVWGTWFFGLLLMQLLDYKHLGFLLCFLSVNMRFASLWLLSPATYLLTDVSRAALWTPRSLCIFLWGSLSFYSWPEFMQPGQCSPNMF